MSRSWIMTPNHYQSKILLLANCHEFQDKVENYKEDIVVEKEELVMKKDLKNKEIKTKTLK